MITLFLTYLQLIYILDNDGRNIYFLIKSMIRE